MNLSTYSTIGDFIARARDVYERHEVEFNLPLGICGYLQQLPKPLDPQPFLATVDDGATLSLITMMTPPHNVILSAEQDVPDEALSLVIEELLAQRWPVRGCAGKTALARRFADLWAQTTGKPYSPGPGLRIYELRHVEGIVRPSGVFRRAHTSDVDELARWCTDFFEEVHPEAPRADDREAIAERVDKEELSVWDDEGLVSMAAPSRPTRHGVAINLVYTPPPSRRKGYGTACVASLCGQLLAGGKQFCCLFADIANPVSNRMYQRIGFKPVCEHADFLFQDTRSAGSA